jgi:hypothetical protein
VQGGVLSLSASPATHATAGLASKKRARDDERHDDHTPLAERFAAHRRMQDVGDAEHSDDTDRGDESGQARKQRRRDGDESS